MKILLASDHAGFELKNHLVNFLKQESSVRNLDLEVEDCGPYEYNESDNYPELIAPVAERVSASSMTEPDPEFTEGVRSELVETRGIVIGGSGQGEAIVADKFDNVRATVYYGGPLEIVELGRKHNDANILSLGARFVTKQEAETACLLFLQTEFEGGRHEKRIEEIEKIEETN